MFRRFAFLALVLSAAAAAATAQNNVHTGARLVVPDGSLYADNTAGPTARWFAATVEAGRSYVIEAYNSSDGLTTNRVQLDLYENDGATLFVSANNATCASALASPALEASTPTGSDGARCGIQPVLSTATRILKIKVTNPDQGPPATGATCLNCTFHIRVRETTVLSRWSVNGYNMFVAVHNPSSAVPAFGFVLYYPDSPTSPFDFVAFDSFNLAAQGTIQFVRNSQSLTPNHGSIHLVHSDYSVDLDVQTYAFSLTSNNFNVFTPSKPNQGSSTAVGN